VKESASPQLDDEILALERAALVRWCQGDPSGYLEICADDIVYFDPFIERRIDGLAALRTYYESLRGKISAPRWEILDPLVQHSGNIAVLTFHFVSGGGSEGGLRWTSSETYRHGSEGWRLIHSHWSFAQSKR
jgi:ketosteroid isomerase-like protein